VTAATERLKSDQARLDVTLRGATDEDVQQAQAALDHAQQDLAKAQQPYTPADLRGQELAVQQAAAQLQKTRNPYTDQDTAAAQAAVDGAQAQLETAELALGETTVIAPVDGVVSERLVSQGALVSPQTSLLTLVPPAVEVLVNVDESRLGQLARGQSVQIGVAAYPDQTFKGEITSISPTLDTRTRTAAVHVQPADADGHLQAGMFAQLNITTGSRQNGLLVPSSAVLSNAARPEVVAISRDNVIQLQPVKLGLRNDDFVEILSGLDQGALVATSSLTSLHDGDVVTPRPAEQPALALGPTNPE
jgi:HlyD family secretion protein